ncbi:LacI family DNA-binding transcriptional regulator [Paenibacillus sp. PL91]|uniref:LacI family DNA-binding transcriptional regulator n=1 Tax=Paenibacillus sp. PL91 TaxID=2729538 RepID=UPI00145F75C4|nr:LacI family DNA-binding transcriptional regulator [Paenibacillus sp. PL91]MBC9203844.1 LacI family DNA-binding transcriptional regulator [Paenibacillus sp. PL91]
MKIRLKDIAAKTGYSINTVSRALKGKGDLTEATRQFILHTAKEMGYIPNGIARGLRSGSMKTIAVILSDLSNPFFSIMANFIEVDARKKDYAIFVLNSGEKQEMEEQAIYLAINKGVDGIILFPVQGSTGSVGILKNANIPFVLVGRHFENEQTDYLITDDVRGGYLATEYLLSKGAKRILFLCGPSSLSCSREREEGYKQALAASGIAFDSSLVVYHEVTMGNTYAYMKDFVQSRDDYTGIFAFSDLIALEAIYAIQEAGFRVPEDIKVVGYDNIQSQLFYPFPLTTINIAKEKMAGRAVEIILNKIKGEAEKEFYQEVFDTVLIERKSC